MPESEGSFINPVLYHFKETQDGLNANFQSLIGKGLGM